MADFAPPTGPPPPRVPEGWKAIWNAQYNEYFYVNIYTKQSTWEKPTEPVYPSHGGESEMPPGYSSGGAPVGAGTDTKKPFESNNPYGGQHTYGQNTAESDEAYARRLQEEENARLRGSSDNRGHGNEYYGAGGNTGSAGYGQSHQPAGLQGGYPGAPDYNSQSQSQYQTAGADRGKSGGGLFGKLKDKLAAGSAGGGRPMGGGMMGGSMMGGGHSQQYGHYPQQGYGGYPQQGYGGMQQGYGGGYGGGMYGQPARKKPGMGAGGAAALGVGGGLLGGMMLANAMVSFGPT